LDHDDVIWNGSKGGKFWRTKERGEDETKSFREEWEELKVLCSRKPHTLF
jgi:hypothetical protein